MSVLIVGLVAAVVSGVVAYRLGGPYGERFDTLTLRRVYNQQTGEIEALNYDADGDLRLDTWTYWEDGHRVRSEIDDNEDGRIDRWHFFDASDAEDAVPSREGFSSAGDGVMDAWRYPGEEGDVERIEFLDRSNARVVKTEFYSGGALMRTEADTDGDGDIDDRIVFFEDPSPRP